MHFIGVEGGGTHSTGVLTNENGDILSECETGGTNQWLLGVDVVGDRLWKLITDLVEKANLPSTSKLSCVGLSLSGINQPTEQKKLEKKLKTLDTNSCIEKYWIRSDTFAPFGLVKASEEEEVIVVICGTGSIAKNKSGRKCGGWGHLLGDEASAYTISSQIIQEFLRRQESFGGISYNEEETEEIHKAIMEHFSIPSDDLLAVELLRLFYHDFKKDELASFAVRVAKLASSGNIICRQEFEKAGRDLADMILAVSSIDYRFYRILCVGNVWNSWDLLKPSIIGRLKEKSQKEYRFSKVHGSSAVGAAMLAAEDTHPEECNFPSRLTVDDDLL